MTIRNDQLLTPKLTDLIQSLRLDIFRSMNCMKVGEISSFNPTKKTAEVKILFKRVLPSGETADYPLLVDCPVVIIQGGGASLQFPISPGDQCLLFFSDRNIDNWFQTGAAFPPANSRAHDMSDGFALVGVNALNSSMPAPAADQARILAGVARVGVLKDGSEAFIRYSDTRVWCDSTGSHMEQGDAHVGVNSGKATIEGVGGTLLAAIEGLIDILEGLTVVDPISGPLPVSPAVIAQLEAQKLVLEGVLNA